MIRDLARRAVSGRLPPPPNSLPRSRSAYPCLDQGHALLASTRSHLPGRSVRRAWLAKEPKRGRRAATERSGLCGDYRGYARHWWEVSTLAQASATRARNRGRCKPQQRFEVALGAAHFGDAFRCCMRFATLQSSRWCLPTAWLQRDQFLQFPSRLDPEYRLRLVLSFTLPCARTPAPTLHHRAELAMSSSKRGSRIATLGIRPDSQPNSIGFAGR